MLYPTTSLSMVNLSMISIIRTVMVCSDLKKAYLLACGPEWVMICGGLTLSHHLTRMLMGSEGGLNEWFLWQQLYNLNVWEGEKT